MKNHIKTLIITMCAALLLSGSLVSAQTKSQVDTYISNMPEYWPEAPSIASEAAILVDADSETILYAKNATRYMYPASTTKLMTAYLTLTNSSLSDIITFSKNSIYSLPSGSSHIGMHIGESLTVKDCLYGLLLPSANEVATALAEHVSGSVNAFTELMNQTAEELGCVNTHFANANGLQDPNHVTCAYDLYRIMNACIQNTEFINISSTAAYVRKADSVLDRDIPMGTTNELIKKGSEYYNPDVICGKTGWTEEAGRCLVTYSAQDDRHLICVVMKSEAPDQYRDTTALINYGFSCFTNYNAGSLDSISSSKDSSPLGLPYTEEGISFLDKSGAITLPSDISDDRLCKTAVVNDDGSRSLIYYIDSYPVGSADIISRADEDYNDLYAHSNDSLCSLLNEDRLVSISIWLLICIITVAVLIVITAIVLIRYRRASYRTRRPAKESKNRFKFF